MSAIKIYSNDSLWIVMWDHRPPGRFAPHDEICEILRAAIKSRISSDMLSLRIWYSVIIHITYSLLHTCNFFQMLMQINRSNWGHLQKGALCPMLLYVCWLLIVIYNCQWNIQFIKHYQPYYSHRVRWLITAPTSRGVIFRSMVILDLWLNLGDSIVTWGGGCRNQRETGVLRLTRYACAVTFVMAAMFPL